MSGMDNLRYLWKCWASVSWWKNDEKFLALDSVICKEKV